MNELLAHGGLVPHLHASDIGGIVVLLIAAIIILRAYAKRKN